nr:putative holin-like toxin [Enterococcus sp. MJM16]
MAVATRRGAYGYLLTFQEGVAFLSVVEAMSLVFQFGALLIALVALKVTFSKNNKK